MVQNVRRWCYACQVLVIQRNDSGNDGPRFPYQPREHRLQRSYNKVHEIETFT